MDFEDLNRLARLDQLSNTNENTDALGKTHVKTEGIISFHSDLPIGLQIAMTSFIKKHPNWDQYRLIQAALAGFLVQNGVDSRSITRLYIGNMFSCESLINGT